MAVGKRRVAVPREQAGAGAPDPVEEVRIHGISSEGAGVGRLRDGRVVFVHRTTPGERIRVVLREEKPRWTRGDLVEVLEPGEGRREAPCPLYSRCGGCTLQHLSYDHQLRWKGRMIQDALGRIGGVNLDGPPQVEPSVSEFRYRNRVRIHLRRDGSGGVRAGFFALEDPGQVVDMYQECLLPEAPLSRLWEGLRREWGEGASRLPEGKELRLSLRALGEDGILVITGGEGNGSPRELLRRVANLRSIWRRDEGGGLSLLAGEKEVWEERAGRRVPVGPEAFVQVNRKTAEALQAQLFRRIGRPRSLRVVDAYCGIGEVGRRLARHGAWVTGIESQAEAVALARRDAPSDFSVLLGTVEERLPEALPADLVLLNPPRAGVRRSVARTLRDSAVPRIIYVSCDPATLARDLKRMSEVYEVESVEAYDLFPQTSHVETLVVLTRRD